MSKDRMHPVDRHVGQRLRLARVSKKMTQTALADAVGITFQQIQKYEKGANRVSASRLFEFGTVLHVKVSFFFEGAGSADQSGEGAYPDELGFSRVDMEILRSLGEIRDRDLKRSLLALISRMRSKSRVELSVD